MERLEEVEAVDNPSSPRAVDIEFLDISYSIKQGRRKSFKMIINNIYGHLHSGELVAIMGPSGAGKTTLMNVLAGFKCNSNGTRHVCGQVLVNGEARNLQAFHNISCYIRQESNLMPQLTVHESMMVAANLKLSEPSAKKYQLVNSKLENLGIKNCESTRVANLSGGERKRLIIAQELISNPPVVFLDEPTSGLDSSSSSQCISLLKSLAKEGLIVVCTIHQPSSRLFEAFDKLIVLADGHCIYRGAPAKLSFFLSSMELYCPSYYNPADFVTEIACNEHGNFISQLEQAVKDGKCDGKSHTERIRKSKNILQMKYVVKAPNRAENSDVESGLSIDSSCNNSLIYNKEQVQIFRSRFATNCWIQFTVIFKRTFLCTIREPMVTHLQLLAQITTAILIGTLYFNIGNKAINTFNNIACVFFSLLFFIFASMMPTILTFPLEMSVFKREFSNGWYSLGSYYFARTMFDVPFQIVYPIIYCSIMYWMTSQPNDWIRFAIFSSFAIMTTLIGQSLGLLIGAAANVQIAIFLGPIIQIPLLLFSGYFIKINLIPVYLRWFSDLSYIKYSFEGMMLSIYGNDRELLDCEEEFCYFTSPRKILEELNLDNLTVWINFIALVCILLILRITTYLVLSLKIHSEQ